MKRVNTDSELSLDADEFVWSEDGLTHAHAYLLPAIISQLEKLQAKRVIDLGCGNGALTHEIAAAGFEVVGVDVSSSGLEIASRNYPDIEFIQANLGEQLPEHLQHSFDTAIAVEVVEHLLLPRSLFERAREALQPEGRFIVTTPYHGYLKNLALAVTNTFDAHWHPLRDYGHVKFFSPETLAQLFSEQNFQVTGYKGLGRIPVFAKSMIMEGTLR